MSIDVNEVVVSGRLTKDPELQTSNRESDDKARCEFTLAVHGFNDKVDFLRFVAWDSTAENLVRFCRKGREVVVVGKLRREQWESADENGEPRKHDRTIVSARQVRFGAIPQEEEAPVEAEVEAPF
jgi:single-strand DNA-binding protein